MSKFLFYAEKFDGGRRDPVIFQRTVIENCTVVYLRYGGACDVQLSLAEFSLPEVRGLFSFNGIKTSSFFLCHGNYCIGER